MTTATSFLTGARPRPRNSSAPIARPLPVDDRPGRLATWAMLFSAAAAVAMMWMA